MALRRHGPLPRARGTPRVAYRFFEESGLNTTYEWAEFSLNTAYAATPTDRECLKLDVDEFRDVLDPDASVRGTCGWRNGDNAPTLRWSTIDDVQDQAIRLEYVVRASGEQREKQYPIWIERTECNFGGTRPR